MNSNFKVSTLTEEDFYSIRDAVDTVAGAKKRGQKCTMEVALSYGTKAKVYHMGSSNPTIRIDIKEEQ